MQSCQFLSWQGMMSSSVLETVTVVPGLLELFQTQVCENLQGVVSLAVSAAHIDLHELMNCWW